MITVLDASNQPIGPFTLEEVQRRLQAGEFRGDQLAYAEGLTAWTPLDQVIAHVTGGTRPFPIPTPLAPVTAAPVNVAPVVAPAVTVGAPLQTMTPIHPYAGFWLRFVAYLIDAVILSVVVYIPVLIVMFIANPSIVQDISANNQDAIRNQPLWAQLFTNFYSLAIFFTYFPFLESSAWQGTVGKMVLGLKVTDLNGQRLSFWHAFGRTAAKMVSGLTCCFLCFGYVMAGFTARKQALHDLIASTLVFKR